MDLTQLENTQVIILEGVPGSGKTTLQEHLRLSAGERPVIVFPEEALLFGWVHAWLPGIDELRLSLMHRIIDYIENTLSRHPRKLFILNRFHISYLIFARSAAREAYDSLIRRLRHLEVLVLVPQLCPTQITDRALHVERIDPQWSAHLDKRLQESGLNSLAEMYTAEQEKVRQILAEQLMPFEILKAIDPGQREQAFTRMQKWQH